MLVPSRDLLTASNKMYTTPHTVPHAMTASNTGMGPTRLVQSGDQPCRSRPADLTLIPEKRSLSGVSARRDRGCECVGPHVTAPLEQAVTVRLLAHKPGPDAIGARRDSSSRPIPNILVRVGSVRHQSCGDPYSMSGQIRQGPDRRYRAFAPGPRPTKQPGAGSNSTRPALDQWPLATPDTSGQPLPFRADTMGSSKRPWCPCWSQSAGWSGCSAVTVRTLVQARHGERPGWSATGRLGADSAQCWCPAVPCTVRSDVRRCQIERSVRHG